MSKFLSGLLRKEKLEECDTTIGVGDMVLSYDFDLHEDCYFIGEVVSVGREHEGCPRYEIVTEVRVWEGKAELDTRTILPPVNGVSAFMFGGFTDGVRRLF
jgi:hypothetical protein